MHTLVMIAHGSAFILHMVLNAHSKNDEWNMSVFFVGVDIPEGPPPPNPPFNAPTRQKGYHSAPFFHFCIHLHTHQYLKP